MDCDNEDCDNEADDPVDDPVVVDDADDDAYPADNSEAAGAGPPPPPVPPPRPPVPGPPRPPSPSPVCPGFFPLPTRNPIYSEGVIPLNCLEVKNSEDQRALQKALIQAWTAHPKLGYNAMDTFVGDVKTRCTAKAVAAPVFGEKTKRVVEKKKKKRVTDDELMAAEFWRTLG